MKVMKYMFGRYVNLKRKGITPVIAIVLLLMMTVAAAGMAYIWIMSVQEGVEKSTNEGILKQQTDAAASIRIESVWDNGGTISYVIRNTGTHTYTATQIGQFAYYSGGVPITPTVACAGLAAEGTTCQVDTAIVFPAVGATVKLSVKSPVGRSADYSCKKRTATDTSC